MADHIFLGNRASNVDVSPTFQTYSRVIIHINDEQAIEVGNNTGRTLEIDNPFGTQQMAQDLLNRLNGYQYQPYTADGALLNPASEIGDTISASTAYGMIFTRNKQFGRLMKTDISAPCDEEINHEYAFETPEERKFARVTGEMRASIILTQDAITSEVARANQAEGQLSSRITQTAEAITSEVSRATAAEGELSTRITQTESQITADVVSKTGGSQSSFGWSLLATGFTLYSNNQTVFKVNSSGAEVKGKITATSGAIGAFTLDNNALKYNNLNWGDTDKNYGAYIGASGIQLGKNFSVNNAGKVVAKDLDLSGNVTATNMTLKGTLTFRNADGTYAGQMSAADLRDGASKAINGYSDWNSAYKSTSYGGYCYDGASAGYNAATSVSNMTTISSGVGALVATKIYNKGSYISVGGVDYSYNTAYVMSGYGTPITLYYLSA